MIPTLLFEAPRLEISYVSWACSEFDHLVIDLWWCNWGLRLAWRWSSYQDKHSRCIVNLSILRVITSFQRQANKSSSYNSRKEVTSRDDLTSLKIESLLPILLWCNGCFWRSDPANFRNSRATFNIGDWFLAIKEKTIQLTKSASWAFKTCYHAHSWDCSHPASCPLAQQWSLRKLLANRNI